ncbi:RNA 2'-phosphotransferase [Neobacillus mesonae]|nr:RNA 2'-phosphotransferase [Neobacillus mesonae]
MLNKKEEESLSKFMSKLLRHTPEEFGLTLDHEGYCYIQDLLGVIVKVSRQSQITVEDVEQVVRNCPKQRYEINSGYIRANYGHSYGRINYEERTPLTVLYHGTNTKVANKILREGIKPMGRKYVHLSETLEFASLAGKRRGELVILKVDAQRAADYGVKFYVANHGVWLADYVPQGYLSKL